MSDYNKNAFIAGYRAAMAFRGILPSPSIVPYVRQLCLHKGYEVIRHNDHKFTITWTVDNQGTQGIILYPDLYPVILTGAVKYIPPSGGRGNIQFGECTIKGTMPTVITTGANRKWWDNSIPSRTEINNEEKSLDSIFFGEVYSSPGVILSVTVETMFSTDVKYFYWKNTTDNMVHEVMFSPSKKYMAGRSYELVDQYGDRRRSMGISTGFNVHTDDIFYLDGVTNYRPDGCIFFIGSSEEFYSKLDTGEILSDVSIYNCGSWYSTTKYTGFNIDDPIEETGLLTSLRMID